MFYIQTHSHDKVQLLLAVVFSRLPAALPFAEPHPLHLRRRSLGLRPRAHSPTVPPTHAAPEPLLRTETKKLLVVAWKRGFQGAAAFFSSVALTAACAQLCAFAAAAAAGLMTFFRRRDIRSLKGFLVTLVLEEQMESSFPNVLGGTVSTVTSFGGFLLNLSANGGMSMSIAVLQLTTRGSRWYLRLISLLKLVMRS